MTHKPAENTYGVNVMHKVKEDLCDKELFKADDCSATNISPLTAHEKPVSNHCHTKSPPISK